MRCFEVGSGDEGLVFCSVEGIAFCEGFNDLRVWRREGKYNDVSTNVCNFLLAGVFEHLGVGGVEFCAEVLGNYVKKKFRRGFIL